MEQALRRQVTNLQKTNAKSMQFDGERSETAKIVAGSSKTTPD